MITWRGTGRTGTDDYLESWDRQDSYLQMSNWRTGTDRTGTGYYLESWDRQDRYR